MELRKVAAMAAWLVLAAAPGFAAGWDLGCGKEGQPACAFSSAKLEGTQNGLCPSGQIFDLIGGGTCWTCPSGLARTVFAVDSDKACEKVATTDFRRAEERGKGRGFFGTDCDSGQFWDIVDGNCHSCPAGYSNQILEHVHGDRKCGKSIPGSFARASKIGPPCGDGKLWDPRNGGECWSCPNRFNRTIAPVQGTWACEFATLGGGTGLFGCDAGLSSIRGTCHKTGVCGKDKQRPCEVGERLPSCDAGLKEDFKQNLCVALKPGETPFTAGFSSLAGYWGATLQGHCRELIGGIPINIEGDVGVGARCGRDVTAGFICAFARDVAAGETDLVNALLETSPKVASLADQMNAAANASPCKELGERFAKATDHGMATGAVLKTDCPAGQFWDPNGHCYSCPKDFGRTLFPVTHDRACTDKIGANLIKFGCGAFKGVEKNFNQPVKCTIEVLENGSIFERPVDLKNANQAVCMATGELGYNMVKAAIEIGKAAVTGDVTGIVTAVGKIKNGVINATDMKRLLDCGKKRN